VRAREGVRAIAHAPACRFHDNSVDLKRRPPKPLPWPPLVSVASFFRELGSERGSGPQGLRRPRFSFFLFTCQTARGHGRPGPPVYRRAVETPGPRQTIGSLVTTVSEELRRRAIAPSSGRHARRRLYRPAMTPMSTLASDFDSLDSIACCSAKRDRSFSNGHTSPAMRCALAPTPHCGHIPPPFLQRRREVTVRGNCAGVRIGRSAFYPTQHE
jgi:hypothetical protein